jgi:biopolymer transport protein ExbB/TolQ
MISISLRKYVADGWLAFLIGMTLGAIFYGVVHQPFMKDSILQTYTTHHITEYVIVLLFFWASAEHLMCFLRAQRERRVIGRQWLPAQFGLEEPEQASALLDSLTMNHSELRSTMMYRRIQSGLRFVYERRSAEGFREYLEALATRDSDQIYERYGFSRFVTTILPIVGLIGTVVHFGTALTGLSMEGLSDKLPAMLSGMGTAFNTTFTAMSCLAITLLTRFLIERSENSVLQKINAFIEDELLYRFKNVDSSLKPFMDALSESHSMILSTIGSFEKVLVDEWNERLNATQKRWEQVDQRQEENLVHFLRIVEQNQANQIQEVRQVNHELATAQQMTNDIATSLIGDGKLLALQDRLVQNLNMLHQSQQLEDAMHELTAAIHLFTARQNGTTPLRVVG